MHKLDELLHHLSVVNSQNDDNLLHYGVKGMKWDKRKEKEDPEVVANLAKEHGISKADATDLARLIRTKKPSPQQVKNTVAIVKAMRNSKKVSGAEMGAMMAAAKSNNKATNSEAAQLKNDDKIRKAAKAAAKKYKDEKKAKTVVGKLKAKLKSKAKAEPKAKTKPETKPVAKTVPKPSAKTAPKPSAKTGFRDINAKPSNVKKDGSKMAQWEIDARDKPRVKSKAEQARDADIDKLVKSLEKSGMKKIEGDKKSPYAKTISKTYDMSDPNSQKEIDALLSSTKNRMIKDVSINGGKVSENGKVIYENKNPKKKKKRK